MGQEVLRGKRWHRRVNQFDRYARIAARGTAGLGSRVLAANDGVVGWVELEADDIADARVDRVGVVLGVAAGTNEDGVRLRALGGRRRGRGLGVRRGCRGGEDGKAREVDGDHGSSPAGWVMLRHSRCVELWKTDGERDLWSADAWHDEQHSRARQQPAWHEKRFREADRRCLVTTDQKRLAMEWRESGRRRGGGGGWRIWRSLTAAGPLRFRR